MTKKTVSHRLFVTTSEVLGPLIRFHYTFGSSSGKDGSYLLLPRTSGRQSSSLGAVSRGTDPPVPESSVFSS